MKVDGEFTEGLRRVKDSAGDDANLFYVVQAAVLLDEAARDLRGRRSGKQVILDLLVAAQPQPVPAGVLRHASGIQEYARRIRELRDEGHMIEYTGDGYRLVSAGNAEPA